MHPDDSVPASTARTPSREAGLHSPGPVLPQRGPAQAENRKDELLARAKAKTALALPAALVLYPDLLLHTQWVLIRPASRRAEVAPSF